MQKNIKVNIISTEDQVQIFDQLNDQLLFSYDIKENLDRALDLLKQINLAKIYMLDRDKSKSAHTSVITL